MKNKIYYAGFYDIDDSKRMFAIPAVVKMNYIIRSLNQNGYNVEILSPSFILRNKKYLFEKGGTKIINTNTKLWLPPSFGFRTKIGIYFSAFISFAFWFLKLLRLKKNDVLILYHTPIFYFPISIAKYFKKFELILEIEEIYTYAFKRDHKKLKKELRIVSKADKFILVNDLMCELLNLDSSKTITCYGPYEMSASVEPKVFSDNKIHIVYAGSFSKIKGGAHTAVNVAKYLNQDYKIHILGFGNLKEVEDIKSLIKSININSQCKVIYEGKKTGNDYYSFMKACHYALNPQKSGDYMLYAFPSKVLVYLYLGLNVITTPLESLTKSSLSNCLNFVEDDTPFSFANSILSSSTYDKSNVRNEIKLLHDLFVDNLGKLIS